MVAGVAFHYLLYLAHGKREGEAGGLKTTPAEWAASLLEEYHKLIGKSEGTKKA